MSKEWFILQFKPNAYRKATMNLNRQGFKTFLPLHDITLRKTSQFTNTTRPLFPGYMFIKFDKKKSEWHKINNTYGVLRLVSFNSTLKAIPTKFIDELMSRCDLTGKIIPAGRLAKGDQVKVLRGPFTNFIATVETYENDQRIWILMDLMGRKTKIRTLTKDLHLPN
ncbi:transcriptional activator RfaH [Amylibacter sp.]|nr:transcriptional activator RfaH [Amylibacter sp.]